MGSTDLRMRSGIFYVATSVLLGLIVTRNLDLVLPEGVASRISHNSEALLVALLIAALLQGVYRGRARTRVGWIVALGIGGTSLIIALLLLRLDLPPTVTTLNESFAAFALLAPYLWLPRPVRLAFCASLALIVLVILFFHTDLVLRQAESLVLLILAPIAFDVGDPSLVDDRAQDRPARRAAWMLLLLGGYVLLGLLAPGARENLSGPVAQGIDYAYRGAEGFIALLLVHLYFSFWLGRRWRGLPSGARRRTGAVTGRVSRPSSAHGPSTGWSIRLNLLHVDLCSPRSRRRAPRPVVISADPISEVHRHA